MEPLDGVDIIQGDFTDCNIQKMIRNTAGDDPIVAIFSDMAPNFTGHRLVEHAKIENICDSVVAVAQELLHSKGFVVQKIFHGPSFEPILKIWKKVFVRVDCFKPEASRTESAEIYIVAHQLRNKNFSVN
jgi:23S rRNA (uridine2552-2'-O)-methyltransferase